MIFSNMPIPKIFFTIIIVLGFGLFSLLKPAVAAGSACARDVGEMRVNVENLSGILDLDPEIVMQVEAFIWNHDYRARLVPDFLKVLQAFEELRGICRFSTVCRLGEAVHLVRALVMDLWAKKDEVGSDLPGASHALIIKTYWYLDQMFGLSGVMNLAPEKRTGSTLLIAQPLRRPKPQQHYRGISRRGIPRARRGGRPINHAFASWLEAMMKRHGIASYTELAGKMNVTAATISNHVHSPELSADVLKKYAEYFNTTEEAARQDMEAKSHQSQIQ